MSQPCSHMNWWNHAPTQLEMVFKPLLRFARVMDGARLATFVRAMTRCWTMSSCSRTGRNKMAPASSLSLESASWPADTIHTTVLIYWLALCANPIIESIGFTPDAPRKTLPSQTKRPCTPYTSLLPSTTAFLGSAPIRHVPI